MKMSNSHFRRPRAAEVLLVEDDEGDAILIRESLNSIGYPINFHRVCKGSDCQAFLKNEGIFAKAPVPDLILLDLDLPVIDRLELLKELLDDQTFRRVPVVILSNSRDDGYIKEMYRMHCSTYIIKPSSPEELERYIKVICDYWFCVASLPGEDA